MKYALSCFLALAMAAPAAATSLRITVTNDAQENGFALTPVYTAFHNGDFDSYNPGEAATLGLEALAEVGNFAPIRDERIAATTDQGNPSAGAVFSSFTPDGGRRPLFGGESATVDVELTNVATQRYFSFLSMVIPTNDLFIANGDPFAFELFDAQGNFLGDREIKVTGAAIRDAGTEVNDRTFGVAFAAGQNGGEGAVENGVVTTNGYDELIRYVGLDTAGGFTIDPALKNTLLDFSADEFAVATIRIESVAPVPLPASSLMLLSAVGFAGFVARRKHKARTA
ncbi:MAG: spondin domain-containing protein [Pseudomonadota bacterium]